MNCTKTLGDISNYLHPSWVVAKLFNGQRSTTIRGLETTASISLYHIIHSVLLAGSFVYLYLFKVVAIERIITIVLPHGIVFVILFM